MIDKYNYICIITIKLGSKDSQQDLGGRSGFEDTGL
jgi:hypothetical protein